MPESILGHAHRYSLSPRTRSHSRMMRTFCLLAVAMLAAPASAFIPQTSFRSSSPVVSRSASRRTAPSMMAARRPFIAGNWKENPDTLEAALDLAKAVRSTVNETGRVRFSCVECADESLADVSAGCTLSSAHVHEPESSALPPFITG